MKILVTGGLGFIGLNFVRKFHKDYHITVVDKQTYAAWDPKHLPKNVVFEKRDIIGNIDDLVKKADIVVHFAAESHVDNSIKDPSPFFLTNIMGTLNVIEACIRYGRRLHHVSTDEVFGDATEPFTEESPYQPSSPYSATKAASDHLVRAWGRTHGLRYTISNCGNNYGPYQNDEKFIPTVVKSCIKDGKIPVYGNGKNIRNWIYAEDHIDAIKLILDKGKLGETYLVGTDDSLTNLEVVETIMKKVGKGEIEWVKDRPGHDFAYLIDASKIKKELSWKPNYSFEQGIEATIGWYK